jgi:hypothetical protein
MCFDFSIKAIEGLNCNYFYRQGMAIRVVIGQVFLKV